MMQPNLPRENENTLAILALGYVGITVARLICHEYWFRSTDLFLTVVAGLIDFANIREIPNNVIVNTAVTAILPLAAGYLAGDVATLKQASIRAACGAGSYLAYKTVKNTFFDNQDLGRIEERGHLLLRARAV